MEFRLKYLKEWMKRMDDFLFVWNMKYKNKEYDETYAKTKFSR